MERDELRLECLKLAVSRTPDQAEALAKAKQYVDFVNESAETTKPVSVAAKAAPHVGNAKPS